MEQHLLNNRTSDIVYYEVGGVILTTMSSNNQKEDESKKALSYFLSPWQMMEASQDTGIDVFVQPYDERKRNDNGSIPIYERRFLVQLKSTDSEDIGEESGVAKFQIDKDHLEMWNEQVDPVMIARYFRKKKVFYFTWIDEIEIKTNQKSQTIELPYQLNSDLADQTKEIILQKLVPPVISDLVYIPKSRGIGFAQITIGNLRDGQQMVDMINKGFLDQFSKQVQIQTAITEHRFQLFEQPKNIRVRFNLALLEIMASSFNTAAQELNLLSYTFNMSEAKIMMSVLAQRDMFILNNIEKIKFSYYFKIIDAMDSDTNIKAIIDGVEYNIGTYSNIALELPVKSFTKIDNLKLSASLKDKGRLGSGRLFSRKVHLNNRIQILRGIKIEDQSYHEHDVVLVEDELKIQKISFN